MASTKRKRKSLDISDDARSRKRPRGSMTKDQDIMSPIARCISSCLELFPDIEYDYLHKLSTDYKGGVEVVVTKIVEVQAYPKQSKVKEEDSATAPAILARERAVVDYRRTGRPPIDDTHSKAIRVLLRQAFPYIPMEIIDRQRKQTQYLFDAYIALEEVHRSDSRPYVNRRRLYADKDPPTLHEVAGDPDHWLTRQLGEKGAIDIMSELDAAVAHCDMQRVERENLDYARLTNGLAECAVCFDDSPMNRMVHCDGDQVHFTCLECITEYLKSQIGYARPDLYCPHGEDGNVCGARFPSSQIDLIPDKKLVEKLHRLQQEHALRMADIDGIAECPFCDFKAIYPPIEYDSEFRCLNHDCQLISCRRCSKSTHIPLSCEDLEAKNNQHATEAGRHKLEEARTAALIRTCNRCKKPFVKENGCNRIYCSCGNCQCYTCGEDANTGYTHFADSLIPSGKCFLWDPQDGLQARHHDEVEAADKEAREDILASNPVLKADDLAMKFAADIAPRPAVRPRSMHGLPPPRVPQIGEQPVVAAPQVRPAYPAIAPPFAYPNHPGVFLPDQLHDRYPGETDSEAFMSDEIDNDTEHDDVDTQNADRHHAGEDTNQEKDFGAPRKGEEVHEDGEEELYDIADDDGDLDGF